MKKILLATLAISAMSTSAFAQALPTLSETTSATSAAVTSSVSDACNLAGTLSTFAVAATVNGAFTAPGAQTLTVTCNNPLSEIAIGSTNMTTNAVIAAGEESTFTTEVAFNAVAGSSNGYTLDSSATTGTPNSWSVANNGGEENRRIRELSITVGSFDTAGKLPVAGNYSGLVCVTITPAALAGIGAGNGTGTCAAPTV